ncbi:hypothetical protein HELRODRAFT_186265 [Helobdella robusta]|uniref:CDK-activating kinase assembly factor MAT1 n=1 Tax=Helobdella robusta TaxID=6412 RepID=T1FNW1_HELRO|nr:hypothetical protein HELRODRAFT_186265 [Helobdella robusta]ESO11109.1 hypothetical protein HELRODRAFT_186265 [Helobdella robusta]
MEDLCCPRCKSTKYKNPNLKLMVNVCGHSLCEKCVELLFVRGSGKCETCQIPLRRNNFRIQVFESPEVERDIDIRKKVLKDYNKKEKDFSTLREYNDYLEEVETIVFNLTYGIDVEQTRQKMEQYKQANQDNIKRNRLKISQEEEELLRLIEEEAMEHEIALQRQVQDDLCEKDQKQKLKDNIINDLMFSKLPASHILETHKKDAEKIKNGGPEKTSKFSSGIPIGKQEVQNVSAVSEQVYNYKYQPLHFDNKGPDLPSIDQLENLNYLVNVRECTRTEVAGGFVSEIPCHRALQDAYAGLFIFMDQSSVSIKS